MVNVVAFVISGVAARPSSQTRYTALDGSPSGSLMLQPTVTDANVVSEAPGLSVSFTIGGWLRNWNVSRAGAGSRRPALSTARTPNVGMVYQAGVTIVIPAS